MAFSYLVGSGVHSYSEPLPVSLEHVGLVEVGPASSESSLHQVVVVQRSHPFASEPAGGTAGSRVRVAALLGLVPVRAVHVYYGARLHHSVRNCSCTRATYSARSSACMCALPLLALVSLECMVLTSEFLLIRTK